MVLSGTIKVLHLQRLEVLALMMQVRCLLQGGQNRLMLISTLQHTQLVVLLIKVAQVIFYV